MRKITKLLALVAITGSLFSCSKEVDEVFEPQVSEGIPFTLYASASATKTTNDGLNTNWTAGDQINVFHAVAGSTSYVNDGAFTLVNAATGEFSGNLASALVADTDYDWYMIYPYNANLTTPATTSTQGSKKLDYYTIGGKSQVQSGNNSMAHLCGSIVPFAGKQTSVADDVTPSLTLVPLTSVVAINVTNSSGSTLNVSDITFTATESVVGTYFVNFAGASPVYTASESYYVYTAAPLTVTSGTLTNGASAKYYIAIKPFTTSSGTLRLSVNGLEKTKSISSSTTFAAGSIKTLNFDYDEEIAEPLSTATDVTVGFESSESFTATTTYNNQTVNYDGATGHQWGILSGTVSTNSKITGSNSLQMRWYASASETVPYAFTKFRLSSVGHVSFKAKNTKGTDDIGVKVYYSLDNRASWTLADTFELTTSAEEYVVGFASAKENVAFKFEANLPASLPGSGNLPLIIDDVVFSKDIVNPRVTVAAAAATSVTDEGATMNGTITLVDGAKLSSVTSAGFYYKKTSDPGAFTKVNVSVPLATVNFSKSVTGLDEDDEYTFKAFAVYNSGDEVESSTLTFTPTSTPSEKYSVIKTVSGLTAGTYFMGSNNQTTFAGSTSIQLWTGAVSSNKLSKVTATWDSSTGDFSTTTGVATVTLEAGTGTNVWRIKVGTKYLKASGTSFSLSDDTFDWTFEDRGANEGVDFYNTTSGTYVSCNSASDVARAYDGSAKKYKGIYFFKEN